LQKKGTNINLICRLSFLLPQQNIDVKFLLKFKLIYNFAKPVGETPQELATREAHRPPRGKRSAWNGNQQTFLRS
ncbi:hypothetical protein SM124_15430, partial [Bacillus sp. 31A1R]|nr:hypothetical protein [Bacillus sp. 31A1R]